MFKKQDNNGRCLQDMIVFYGLEVALSEVIFSLLIENGIIKNRATL